MSRRWSASTPRGYEPDRPVSNGPPDPGNNGQFRAEVRPKDGEREVPPRRARVRAS